MMDETNERLFDLLAEKASYGLTEEQSSELDNLLSREGVQDDATFDLAAAALTLSDLAVYEELPQHLNARIMASADEFFAQQNIAQENASPVALADAEPEYQKVFSFEPRRSWSWLGWAFGALALVALSANIWITRNRGNDVAGVTPVAVASPSPERLTAEQELAQLVSSQQDVIRAPWSAGNMKDLKEIGGDVVWSDAKQKGFMRLRGLPINDKTRETYQLWIFDKTQDKATPIDGGTFDVDREGEVIVPIDAKLNPRGPEMFAITVEKAGGVVVSKREKVAALAKVEAPVKSNT